MSTAKKYYRTMSLSRKGNELWMRKQRNFVYNASSGRENPHRSKTRSFSGIPSGDEASRNSHAPIQGQGQCLEDEAVAELCDNLPPNVFDDDVVEIEDDFDEDVLTAEQLEEVDRLTSLELEVVDKSSEQVLRFNDQTETEPYYNNSKDRKPKIREHPQPTRIARPTGNLGDPVSVSRKTESGPTRSKDSDAICAKSLQYRLAELKSDYATAEAKIRLLEDEKVSKDGELKILRDSLEHFRNEEKRLQDQIRNMEQQQVREQSEREKELQKQIDSLSTRLQFKEREVMEVHEQYKKLSSTNQSPPKRKPSTSILGEVFPTGNSFFNQMSPDRQKCPRLTKTSPHSQSIPEKNLPEGFSPAKSKSSSFSAVENEDSCAFSFEMKSMKIQTESRSGINLAGKLLCLENVQTGNLSGLYKNASPDSTSIVSLLWENPGNEDSSNTNLQKGDSSDIINNYCGTLRLFDSQVSPVRTQVSSTSVEEDEYSLARQCLEKLVNLCRENCDSSQQLSSFDLNQDNEPLEIKEEMLVVNFLPVLGQYLARFKSYHDFDESNSSCKKSLTQSESQEVKDDGMVGHMKSGLRMVETAWNTLRVLNVLCLYSKRVRNVILLGGEPRVYSESESMLQKVTSKLKIVCDKNRPSTIPDTKKLDARSSAVNNCNVGQKNELLQQLFRLVVPKQSEGLAVTHGALKVLLTLACNCSPLLLSRFQPLLSENFLSQCLTRDFSLPTVSLVADLLTAVVPQNGLSKKHCAQTDDCILLKIYQAWALTSDTLDSVQQSRIHLKVVQFVNQLLSTDEDAVHLLLEAECPCSLELIKNLVLMLHCELNELNKFPVSSMQNAEASTSFQVVRQGVFLLVNLCLNDRLLEEHRYRVEIEHQYVHLLHRVTRLYKKIPDILSETEVLAFQDLLDLDRYYDVEWSQESEDEEPCEGMDVDN